MRTVSAGAKGARAQTIDKLRCATHNKRMDKLNIAAIGTNYITEWMLQAAHTMQGAAFVGICSREGTRAEAFAAKWNLPRAYAGLDALCADGEIDAAYLATPNGLHCEQAVRLLEAGKHVLVEKPAAVSAREYARMQDAAAQNGRVLMQALPHVYAPAYAALRAALPRLGALRRATFTYCQHSSRYAAFQRGEILNAFNPALGNCALLDLGVYCAGMMVWLLGAPEGVLAKSAFLHNGFEAQGTVVAWYPGLLAELRYSKIADGDNGCELQGERGLLRMQGLRNPMRVELLPRGGGCEVLWEGEEPQLMRYVLREFVRRVRTSEPDALAMQVMTVLDAVRAASGIVL